MKCSNNESCKILSDDILPNVETDVYFDFLEINDIINNTELSLKELTIPEDYLGYKINKELENIYKVFDKTITDNNDIDNNFSNYVDNEIKIHSEHYLNYKIAQEENLANDDIE